MLDRIIQNLYEDKVNDNLTAERFAKMTQIYEEEQTSLTEKASVLRQELMTIKEESDNVNRFMRTIRKYGNINDRNILQRSGRNPASLLKEKGSGTALCRTTSYKRKISIEHTLMMRFFFIINL